MKEDRIKFDFDACNTAVQELERVAVLLQTEHKKMLAEDIFLIKSVWESSSGEVFSKKYMEQSEQLKHIEQEILAQVEELKRISRKMNIIEQEAKRIAGEKEVK